MPTEYRNYRIILPDARTLPLALPPTRRYHAFVMADALSILAQEQSEPPQKRRGQRKSGTWKLRGPALDTALQCLAEYQKISDIVGILKERHNIDISAGAIGRMAHVSRWEEEIFRRRAVLDNKMLDVPISSRWWRQNERHGLFIRSKSSDKLSDTARKTLMDAAEEMGHLRRGETQSQPSIVVNVLAALQGSSPEALRAYAETGALPAVQSTQLAAGVEGHPVGCRCAECPYAKAASKDAIAARPVIDTTVQTPAQGAAVSTESIAVSSAPIAASAPATATASTPTSTPAIAVIPAAGERRAWPQAPPDMQAPGQTNPHVETLLKTCGNPADGGKAMRSDVSSNATDASLAESTTCAESPVIGPTPEAGASPADTAWDGPAGEHGSLCECPVCALWQARIRDWQTLRQRGHVESPKRRRRRRKRTRAT